MGQRVYNFNPGPATLPSSVMERIQAEFLDFKGTGASIIEISHRSNEFIDVLNQAISDFVEVAKLPTNFKVFFAHGGARMQFAALPQNLIARKSKQLGLYVETGTFAALAAKECSKFGKVEIVASGRDSNFSEIPEICESHIDSEASFLHITSNNTVYGSQWQELPCTGSVPLVVDSTSDILGRSIDFNRVGVVYAGLQKNLGPSGLAVVVMRDDLFGTALPGTPTLLDYTQLSRDNSLTNTTNTFAIYVTGLVLSWIKEKGGLVAVEQENLRKSQLLYDFLDSSCYYKRFIPPKWQSAMNVTFNLPSVEEEKKFAVLAKSEGLIGLAGHRLVGGIRASIYNAMPVEGVQALIDFMKEFQRKNG